MSMLEPFCFLQANHHRSAVPGTINLPTVHSGSISVPIIRDAIGEVSGRMLFLLVLEDADYRGFITHQPCTHIFKKHLDQELYMLYYAHIHANRRNPGRCERLVPDGNEGPVADRDRFSFPAEESLHAGALQLVRIEQRPPQLHPVREARKATLINLCPRRARGQDSASDKQWPTDAGVNDGSRPEIHTSSEDSASFWKTTIETKNRLDTGQPPGGVSLLNDQDFPLWCRRLKLSERARTAIERIRNLPPARRVRGGRYNVSGRYPSRKMGVVIQFESHRVELAVVHELERDPDVLEYYDQPPSFPLEYQDRNDRRLVVLHTPDYFAIRRESAGWEECKTEQELKQLAENSPHRYRCIGDRWCCPPGERYAAEYGLYYRVRSSRETNWVYQRNLIFLEDYFRSDPPSSENPTCQAVLALLASQGTTLATLLHHIRGPGAQDEVFRMIAYGDVYVDLYAAPLVEPSRVRVVPCEGTLDSNAGVNSGLQQPPVDSGLFQVAVGAELDWDGRVWTIVNVGETMIEFIGEGHTFTGLPHGTFEELVRKGRIKSRPTNACLSSIPNQLMQEASERDLKEANRRAALVHSYLKKEPLPDPTVKERTLRSFVTRYKRAEALLGAGYLGLLPREHKKGNRKRKLPEDTYRLTQEFIGRDYETVKQKTKYAAYAALLLASHDRAIKPPSYKTFIGLLKQRSRYEQTLKRQGRRSAYRHEPFYWELEQTTPRHGDRPFEIGHIDHTELDIELRCSQTGRNLGRPWMSLLTDAFSRRELVVYLTFDPPSYRSAMMVLRECARRHGRLPQILVLDGGPEFRSTYFETLLARYECTQKIRPPAKARFGSVCERLFGTANTHLIHNLSGNTQLMRNVRQVTQSVNPRNLAVWTLESLIKYLCEWAYEVYDTMEHPALGQSPREAFLAGLAQSGARSHRLIAYDDSFLILTLPTTRKGRAKVFPGRGIKIGGLYYWSDSFRDPAIEQSTVPVRFDPWDAGTAYAYVRNHWALCHSEYFVVFQGRSEKELMIAAAELRRRHSLHSKSSMISAKQLASFLKSAESEELLLTHRLKDNETRRANALPAAPRIQYPEEAVPDYTPVADPSASRYQANQEPSDILDILEEY